LLKVKIDVEKSTFNPSHNTMLCLRYNRKYKIYFHRSDMIGNETVTELKMLEKNHKIMGFIVFNKTFAAHC